MSASQEAVLTFQAEDPVPQGVNNVLQGCLIRDVEEVFVIGVTGDVFDFVQKSFWVDPPAVVVAQDLPGNGGQGQQTGHGTDFPPTPRAGWSNCSKEGQQGGGCIASSCGRQALSDNMLSSITVCCVARS